MSSIEAYTELVAALIGVGVGAVTGLISDPSRLDLGDPPWKR